MVKKKPREVFDVGFNASPVDDDDEEDTYFENVPHNITTDDACDDANDNCAWARVSENELLEQDFINDEEFRDDVYESNDDDESSDDEP